MNLAYYTCFYGSNNNEAFAIPPLPSSTHNCYYYTNNQDLLNTLKTTQWIGVFDDKPTTDDMIESCMASKHVKVLPHLYKELKDYDYLVYLDSKLKKLNESLIESHIQTYFIKQNYALLLRKHVFWQNGIWYEYEQSMKQERYLIQSDNYKKYIHERLDSGLSARVSIQCQCGLLIRNMKHPKIVNINNTWMRHILACGIQDQISFFFVQQFYSRGTILPFTEFPFLRGASNLLKN